MNFIKHIIPILFSILAISNTLNAASLTATVGRTEIEYGRSIELTVVAVDIDGEVDFSGLHQSFDILNTSRAKSVQIVNGKMDSTLTWQISLMPLKTGKIVIPEFSLEGENSKAISLTVKDAGQGVSGGEPRDFILELSVDNDKPFVQQQIVLIARIFQARNILEGTLTDPQSDGIILERLGKDKSYITNKSGRQYSVIERRYALFAQESGVLTISPLRLAATVKKDPNNRNRGFFSNTEQIHVRSNGLSLDVQSRPENVDESGWWLPAETLSFTADWDSDVNNARVDEPITRTLMLSAKGVHRTQLPSIEPPELDTAKIYPDQPETSSQQLDDSILSYRTDKWAIIPRKPGPLELPEIRLSWYDTLNEQFKEEVIAAEVINILPAINTSQHSVPDVTTSSEVLDQADSTLTNQVDSKKDPVQSFQQSNGADPYWKIIAIISIIGWVILLCIWLFRSRSTPKTEQLNTSPRRSAWVADLKHVDDACKSEDPSAISSALLEWSKDQWPDGRARNLKDMVSILKVENDQLGILFRNIDESLYSPIGKSIQCKELAKHLNNAVKQLATNDQTNVFRNGGNLPHL